MRGRKRMERTGTGLGGWERTKEDGRGRKRTERMGTGLGEEVERTEEDGRGILGRGHGNRRGWKRDFEEKGTGF